MFSFIFFTACNSPSKAFDLSVGQATAEIDGREIVFDSSWTLAGTTLQINLEDTDQTSMIMIRLQQNEEGLQISEISDYPTTFSFGNTQNASVTFYPPDSNLSANTQEDSEGIFELEKYEGTDLVGNFSCSVQDQEDQIYHIHSGYINASELDFFYE